MYSQIAVVFLVGLVLGVLQSLLVGIRIGTWDGGTGCLWGLLVGIASGLCAIWIGWWGNAVAVLMSLVCFIGAEVWIRKNGAPRM